MYKTAYMQGVEYVLRQTGLLKDAGLASSIGKGLGAVGRWIKPGVTKAVAGAETKAPGAVKTWQGNLSNNMRQAGIGMRKDPGATMWGGAKNYAKGLTGYGSGLGSTLGKGTTIGIAGTSVGRGIFGGNQQQPPAPYSGYGG